MCHPEQAMPEHRRVEGLEMPTYRVRKSNVSLTSDK